MKNNNDTWKIEVTFSEHPALGPLSVEDGCGASWTSFAALSALLAGAAHSSPKGGSYDKTYVRATHTPSGETYCIRIDLQHPERDPKSSDVLGACQDAVAWNLGNPIALAGLVGEAKAREKLAESRTWATRFSKAQ
jgi:hypothetical protein